MKGTIKLLALLILLSLGHTVSQATGMSQSEQMISESTQKPTATDQLDNTTCNLSGIISRTISLPETTCRTRSIFSSPESKLPRLLTSEFIALRKSSLVSHKSTINLSGSSCPHPFSQMCDYYVIALREIIR